MDTTEPIFIAGRRGMVGSAIHRRLKADGYVNILGPTSTELDLTRQKEVEVFFRDRKPAYIFLAAAKVGGILANASYPAQFIYRNLAIETNVIHAAWKSGARRLIFLGSSCIYPKFCPQPIKEEYLLTGPLEPTNEAYAVAKIAGLKLCEFYQAEYGADFWSLMPTNLYGPNDNYDLQNSHVLPALIRKFHLAKLAAAGDSHGLAKNEAVFGPIPDITRNDLDPTGNRARVVLWGTGSPRREFIHVDDLAAACVHVMNLQGRKPELLNVGCGEDLTIAELAEVTRRVVGFEGEVVWDDSKPDGTPRKLLDVSRIQALGWTASISLEQGVRQAYDWYLERLNR